MAQTRGSHAVKDKLVVSGDGRFEKGLDSPYLEIIDQKLKGTPGGTFTGQEDQPGSTAWQTRDLTNLIHDDFTTDRTLAENPGEGGDITLEKGTYYTEISVPAFNVNEHVARLADVTDNPGAQGATVILGTSEFAADPSLWTDSVPLGMTIASAGQTRSLITGRFSLSSQRKLEVQHLCAVTKETNGFGSDLGFYEVNNVFTILKMWQIRSE